MTFAIYNLVGAALFFLALGHERARPFLAVVASVWACTSISHFESAYWDAALRVGIDVVGGLLFVLMMQQEHEDGRWAKVAAWLFIAMLINHAAFWFAYGLMGIVLWREWAHTVSLLWLAQLVALCWPIGGQLIGRLGDWSDSRRDGRGWWPDVGAGQAARSGQCSRAASHGYEAGGQGCDRTTYGGSHSVLHIPTERGR